MVCETKSPVKNLVRQRCAEGFNSGLKVLKSCMCSHETEILKRVLRREFFWLGKGYDSRHNKIRKNTQSHKCEDFLQCET
jgi:hypothetical protein